MIRTSRLSVPAAVFATLGLFMSGCSAPAPDATQSPSPSASASSPSTPARGSSSGTASKPVPSPSSSPAAVAGKPGALDHVVIIVEENKPSQAIIGSSDAPYINKLATDYAVARNYQAVAHPSLPNYLALTSGTNAGITDDCSPGAACTANTTSIADRITQSGRSWKMYAEDMPAPCTAKNSGNYAVRHNPFMYYPGITNDKASCAAHVVPFTQLAQDLKSASGLPDFSFISPNMCNDMHDCPVATGDAWLSREVPKILASPAFTTQNSLLVIVWDEGENKDNTVSTIFAGPAAKTAYKSDTAFTHYSLLHTIESYWGLPPLTDNDKNAPIMSDLLK
jgi:hypothetical protein